MRKLILSTLAEGALWGLGLILMFWIGGRTPRLEGVLFCFGFGMLGAFLATLPALRVESALRQHLRASGSDGEKVRELLEHEQKKQGAVVFIVRPLGLIVFLCILGLVIRFTR